MKRLVMLPLRQRKKYPVRVYTCVQVEYAPGQWLIVRPDVIHKLYSETQSNQA
jgi:hypothetical protein